jgi:hypothetical protein
LLSSCCLVAASLSATVSKIKILSVDLNVSELGPGVIWEASNGTSCELQNQPMRMAGLQQLRDSSMRKENPLIINHKSSEPNQPPSD